MAQRPEQWGTRWGFILATTGSAVGLGNIWRFPTTAVNSGGGAFILLYLAIILLIGVPIMMTEMVLGRASQQDVVGTFPVLKPGTKWGFVGYISLISAFVILSYYAVIAGWTLLYLLAGLLGALGGGAQELEVTFVRLTGNPLLPLFGSAWFLLVTVAVVVVGVTRGIERWNKVLMPGVVLLLLILMIRALLLPGAIAGAVWLLKPDLGAMNLRIALDALGQVFFSFGLGMGTVLTYGSYLPRTTNIPGSAALVSMADLGVALLAGLIVVPALFAFGVEPGIGPGLLFVTLPAVLSTMPLSIVWMTLFFTMLVFAALSSSVSMLEVVVAYSVDRLGIDRGRASLGAGGLAFILGIPAAMSTGLLSTVRIGGYDPMGIMDFAASNILLPLAGLFTVLFVAWGWGSSRAVAELKLGASDSQLIKVWEVLVKFVIPVAIAYVFVVGLMR